jgi:glycolate oxidase FAD binding subunit
MRFNPSTVDDLQKALATANTAKSRVESVDLSALNRVLEHTPEDMTVTVQGGATLESLQAAVRKRGQWLPIDPPDPSLTIQQLLATNVSGPRRFGYGTIRDYVIGMAVVLADGRLIHSGGKVVKNVAGYDVMKLFIGDQGTLGVIVEVTFKLRPIPETEKVFQKRCASIPETQTTIDSILNSPLTPVILDLNGLNVIVGFDGTREEVEWQTVRAAELGFTEPATLDYDQTFHLLGFAKKLSVLPSKLSDAIYATGRSPFVARAGNGIIFYHGDDIDWPSAPIPKHLQQRVKDTFDPNHILRELR